MVPTAVAAVALVVIGAVVFMITRNGATAVPVAADTPSVISSQPSAEPGPSDPASTPPDADTAFTCWNGKTADTLEACGRATGIEGLKHIYPSLVTQWDRCEYVDYRPTTATYDCQFDEGVIRYRYWKDAGEAKKHYTTKYAKADKTKFVLDGQSMGTLYRATARDKSGVFTMTAWWGDGHYSLSVDAPSRAAQETLWATVGFRAVADLNGYPANETPREAVRS